MKDRLATKVGILLPSYNQGIFINEAIESLRQQTFQDFKVLIVDDASTDGITVNTLKKILYPKAKIVINDKNQGIGNLARIYLKELDAKYVFVLCADDKLEPTYIEECVQYLDNNKKCGAVATWIQCFGTDDKVMKIEPNKIKLPEMLIENGFLGSSMVRYIAMEEIGFGNVKSEFQKHNDYDRWVSILENGWILGVIDKPLFLYRRISTSLSHSINIVDELSFQEVFVKKHKKLFEKYADFITLSYIRRLIECGQWAQELLGGHDWLDSQYKSLTKENSMLRRAIANNKKEHRQLINTIESLKKDNEDLSNRSIIQTIREYYIKRNS